MLNVLKSVPFRVFPVKKKTINRDRTEAYPQGEFGGNSHCCDGFVISAAAAVQLPWRPGVWNNSFSDRQSIL